MATVSTTYRGVLQRIAALSHPSRSYIRLAEFIRSRPKEVVLMPISEVATRSQTSPATVSRFVRILGYNDFREFRVALAADISAYDSDPEQESSRSTSHGTVLDVTVRSLSATASAIDESALCHAGDRLRACNHAGIYGFADGVVAAFDMHRRLLGLGVRSVLAFDIDGALSSAHTLDPACVALAITTTGVWSAVETLRVARAAGAFCIAITGEPNTAVSDVAHLVFVAVTPSS